MASDVQTRAPSVGPQFEELDMRGNGRRVNVFVNESALRAWLTGKPANTSTTPPPTSTAPSNRTDTAKDPRS